MVKFCTRKLLHEITRQDLRPKYHSTYVLNCVVVCAPKLIRKNVGSWWDHTQLVELGSDHAYQALEEEAREGTISCDIYPNGIVQYVLFNRTFDI